MPNSLNAFHTGINNQHIQWCTAIVNHPSEAVIIKLTQGCLTFCLHELRQILPSVYELTALCFNSLGWGGLNICLQKQLMLFPLGSG